MALLLEKIAWVLIFATGLLFLLWYFFGETLTSGAPDSQREFIATMEGAARLGQRVSGEECESAARKRNASCTSDPAMCAWNGLMFYGACVGDAKLTDDYCDVPEPGGQKLESLLASECGSERSKEGLLCKALIRGRAGRCGNWRKNQALEKDAAVDGTTR